MGLYDRDYMKAPAAQHQPRRPTFWQKLKFKLWLLFRKKK